MTDDLSFPFDRVTYRDGQLLSALDLNEDQRHNAWLRRLHARYLHASWGIALGFQSSEGRRGNIRIAPGHAVDGLGHDLLLTKPVQIPVPKASLDIVLVMHYRDVALADATVPERVCLGGMNPKSKQPQFGWCLPEEVCLGDEIPLVLSKADGRLDLGPWHYLRAVKLPRSGWGETDPTETRWVEKEYKGHIASHYTKTRTLQVVVDTSHCGFTRTPCYFAALVGDFSNYSGQTPLRNGDQWAGEGELVFSLNSAGSILFADSVNFVYGIGGPEWQERFRLFNRHVSPAEAQQRRWRIRWLGIESDTTCEDQLAWTQLFDVLGSVAKVPLGAIKG